MSILLKGLFRKTSTMPTDIFRVIREIRTALEELSLSMTVPTSDEPHLRKDSPDLDQHPSSARVIKQPPEEAE
jgi:hypothetical protein